MYGEGALDEQVIRLTIGPRQLGKEAVQDEFVGSEVIVNPIHMRYIGGGSEGIVFKWKDYTLKFLYDNSAMEKLLAIRRRIGTHLTAHEYETIPESVATRTLPIGFGSAKGSDLDLRDMEDMSAIIFNWVDGSPLDHKAPLHFEERCRLSHEVLLGLQFMEEMRIVHADLTPNHFIVDDMRIPHLIDIEGSGLLDFHSDEWLYRPTVIGTRLPGFILPPEVLEGGEVDQLTDRWAGLTIVSSIIARCYPLFFLATADCSSLREMSSLTLAALDKGQELTWPPMGIERHGHLQQGLKDILRMEFFRQYWSEIDKSGHLLTMLFKTFVYGLEERHRRASFQEMGSLHSRSKSRECHGSGLP